VTAMLVLSLSGRPTTELWCLVLNHQRNYRYPLPISLRTGEHPSEGSVSSSSLTDHRPLVGLLLWCGAGWSSVRTFPFSSSVSNSHAVESLLYDDDRSGYGRCIPIRAHEKESRL